MKKFYQQIQEANIDWKYSEKSKYVFQALFDGKNVELRLNDFPEEALCTIIRGEQEVDIHEFPKRWTLPKHRA